MVHSPLVPALPPIGGRPPTSTILNTSTSSETRPLRACAIVSARAFNWATSPEIKVSRGTGGRSFAWERVRRRVARFSRKARTRCLATGKFRVWIVISQWWNCVLTSVVLPPQIGEPVVQFVEPFLAPRKICASHARFTYGVDGGGSFANLFIPVNGGVLDLQAKVA